LSLKSLMRLIRRKASRILRWRSWGKLKRNWRKELRNLSIVMTRINKLLRKTDLQDKTVLSPSWKSSRSKSKRQHFWWSQMFRILSNPFGMIKKRWNTMVPQHSIHQMPF
jgi:hypothetical protein